MGTRFCLFVVRIRVPLVSRGHTHSLFSFPWPKRNIKREKSTRFTESILFCYFFAIILGPNNLAKPSFLNFVSFHFFVVSLLSHSPPLSLSLSPLSLFIDQLITIHILLATLVTQPFIIHSVVLC
ncbi:MAG: hypothetical protein JOS17DRAFT_214413 [Linnemannia elongata]|nr:MAG: hypothetical protein JOS17DRAFT_214413 [Linnemannia elongata]